MKRKIYNRLLEWKQERSTKEALLIDGARRVGKSFIVEEFALLDVPRRKVPDLIVGLRKRDINVIMLTGDNERTAGFVAEEIGINEVKAGVLPEDKAYYVKELKKNGLLAMVGDGINDSIALAEAVFHS